MTATPAIISDPNWVLVYQTTSAIPFMVETALERVGLIRNEHYTVNDNYRVIMGALTSTTRLLVVGAHQDGGTTGLEELIGHARSLNPGIIVLGYSLYDLGHLLIDEVVDKTQQNPERFFASKVLAAIGGC